MDRGGALWELSQAPAPGLSRRLKWTQAGQAMEFEFSPPGQPQTSGQNDAQADLDPVWERLLNHHLERMWAWTEDRRADASVVHTRGLTVVPWREFLASYWSDEDSGEDHAPRHLIVRIAQQCGRWTKALCDRPRKILRRDRRQQDLAKVQDVDAQCLRWLIRQPGTTLTERAGSRQRILAVVRDESVDTLENRVLRDFLVLSSRVAKRYIRDYGHLTDSKRVKDVRAWSRLASDLLLHSAIAGVPSLVGAVERNYVLQYDSRYAELWQWYDRLRSQENDRESLLPWQHRTWSEYVGLAVWDACVHEAPVDGSFGANALVRHKADHGCFLDARMRLGPWPMMAGGSSGLVRLFRGDQLMEGVAHGEGALSWLGADMVLSVGRAFVPPDQSALVGVWALYEPFADEALCRRRLDRLAAALHDANPGRKVGGLVVMPGTGAPADVVCAHRHLRAIRLPVLGDAPAQDIRAALRVALGGLVGLEGRR